MRARRIATVRHAVPIIPRPLGDAKGPAGQHAGAETGERVLKLREFLFQCVTRFEVLVMAASAPVEERALRFDAVGGGGLQGDGERSRVPLPDVLDLHAHAIPGGRARDENRESFRVRHAVAAVGQAVDVQFDGVTDFDGGFHIQFASAWGEAASIMGSTPIPASDRSQRVSDVESKMSSRSIGAVTQLEPAISPSSCFGPHPA